MVIDLAPTPQKARQVLNKHSNVYLLPPQGRRCRVYAFAVWRGPCIKTKRPAQPSPKRPTCMPGHGSSTRLAVMGLAKTLWPWFPIPVFHVRQGPFPAYWPARGVLSAECNRCPLRAKLASFPMRTPPLEALETSYTNPPGLPRQRSAQASAKGQTRASVPNE